MDSIESQLLSACSECFERPCDAPLSRDFVHLLTPPPLFLDFPVRPYTAFTGRVADLARVIDDVRAPVRAAAPRRAVRQEPVRKPERYNNTRKRRTKGYTMVPKREATMPTVVVMAEWTPAGRVIRVDAAPARAKVSATEQLAAVGEDSLANLAPALPFDIKRKVLPEPGVLPALPTAARRAAAAAYAPVCVTKDETMLKLAAEDAGDVFADASVLEHLAVAGRLSYGYDFVVVNVNGKRFLTTRLGSAAQWQTAFESSATVSFDEEAATLTPIALAHENTQLDANFVGATISAPATTEKDAAVVAGVLEEDAPAGAGVRAFTYRRIVIDGIRVVYRAPLYGKFAGALATVHCNLLDAFSPNGRVQIDSFRQRLGALEAASYTDNAVKMIQFYVEALLTGADFVRLGFAIRGATSGHSIVYSTNTPRAALKTTLNIQDDAVFGRLAQFMHELPLPETATLWVRDGSRRTAAEFVPYSCDW